MHLFPNRRNGPAAAAASSSAPSSTPPAPADSASTSTPSGAAVSTITREALLEQAFVMFGAGAVLGPFCDGLHSSGDVLHYTHPDITSLGPIQLETCWWVPVMFGIAGLILGVSYPVLDVLSYNQQQPGQQQLQQGQQQQRRQGQQLEAEQPLEASGSASAPPSPTGRQAPTPATSAVTPRSLVPGWPKVLLCISLFVCQYKLSAVLDPHLTELTPGLPDVVLLAYGLAVWRALDATPQGLAMSALTAAAGPALEMGLINGLGLYHYSHPQVLGVPTWIPWVYFCGGPAVGLLGRRVWATLEDKRVAGVQAGAGG